MQPTWKEMEVNNIGKADGHCEVYKNNYYKSDFQQSKKRYTKQMPGLRKVHAQERVTQ